MELIHKLAQNYAERFSSKEEPLLKTIADHTYANHPHSNMLSGHLQGKLLEMLSRLIKPKYILEIGTFTGYSGICLAQGLQPGGWLHTIELREEDALTAADNFNKAGLSDKIRLHTGNALEVIPVLEHEWDLIFIDADKTGYIDYYKMVLPRLKPGGVILADNVLFHGDVLQDEVKTRNGKAIHAFNQMVEQDESVEKIMLTVRDGLSVILKK